MMGVLNSHGLKTGSENIIGGFLAYLDKKP